MPRYPIPVAISVMHPGRYPLSLSHSLLFSFFSFWPFFHSFLCFFNFLSFPFLLSPFFLILLLLSFHFSLSPSYLFFLLFSFLFTSCMDGFQSPEPVPVPFSHRNGIGWLGCPLSHWDVKPWTNTSLRYEFDAVFLMKRLPNHIWGIW